MNNSVMTPANDQTAPNMAQLRHVILPETLDTYWLAPGWILLLGATLVLAAVLYLLWKRRQSQTQYKREAHIIIDQWLAHQNPNDTVTPSQLASLSALLKRVAMHIEQRSNLAQLYGKPWAKFLDARAPGAISPENLRLLSEGEYQSTLVTQTNCQQIAEQCQRWVKMQRQTNKGSRHAAI